MPDTTQDPSTSLWIKAKPGLLVPLEGRPGTYVPQDGPVQVEDTEYMRRALRDGDVLLCDPPVASSKPAKSSTSSSANASAGANAGTSN